MKKIIFLITLTTFYLLLFISCHKDKCESNNLGNVSFTSTDLQIVPYNGTETLTFSDSLGNTLIYLGYGRNSNYNQIFYQFPSPDPDVCQGNYFYSETNSTGFEEGKSGNYVIWTILSMDGGSPFHQNINKFIEISVEFIDNSGNWFFDQFFYFDALKLTKPKNITASSIFYSDSLIIGPKKFYSVYVLKQISNPYGLENLQYVFYTITQGIIGFRTKADGHTWYLN